MLVYEAYNSSSHQLGMFFFFFSEKCVCKQQENGCDMLTKNNYGCFTQFFRTYSMLQHIFRETQVIGAYTTQIFMGFDLSL